MRTIFKTTVIAALAATTFSSAVQAQSEISKRERILQVLDQSRPNEYVPAAFFLHFPDKLGRKAVADHAEYYEATNMDFVKVFYEIDPASIINVPLNFSDGSQIDLKEAQKRFNRPIFGGLDRLGIIATGSLDEAKAAVDKVLENAPNNFILGADCTIPGSTDYDKLRAVIEYAHTWRQTHKK